MQTCRFLMICGAAGEGHALESAGWGLIGRGIQSWLWHTEEEVMGSFGGVHAADDGGNALARAS